MEVLGVDIGAVIIDRVREDDESLTTSRAQGACQ
jgi:hypothetical protein